MFSTLLAKIFSKLFLFGLSPLAVQSSFYWGGLVTGDATLAPYSADEFHDIWRKLFQRDRTLEGVLPDYLNELAVTNPAGVTIRTASGGALVDGTFFDNTANVDQVVVAPGGGSNFYRVVLEKDWALQTVRIALLGPNVAVPDAVTQNDGVTWEISLATIEITSGSVVTVTDDRTYMHFNTEVNSAMIAANAITNAKMADDAIDTDELVDLAVTNAKLAAGAALANILPSDGAGSGLDADLLDGQHGAYYQNILTTLSASSDIALTNTAVLIPGMTGNFTTGTYLVIASIPFIIQGTSGQYADINLQLFLDAVLQNGEAHDKDDIDASNRDRLATLTYAWRVVVSGTQAIQVRASKVAGSTATVQTRWQIDKAQIMFVNP